MKRQEIAAGEVTRSGVAERVGRKQNALCKLVAQSEDVLVDTRGIIYVTHKNQGLWILRYTGK